MEQKSKSKISKNKISKSKISKSKISKGKISKSKISKSKISKKQNLRTLRGNHSSAKANSAKSYYKTNKKHLKKKASRKLAKS
jgi:hypothetical protein